MSQIDVRTVAGEVTTVSESAISALTGALRGRLVQPSDRDYDDVRAVWNGMIDRRPALIARCGDAQDVAFLEARRPR